ncbi:putative Ig domain-containing protein [Stenoxybacter acetivorans]|uniref:putative Ig domain-containing protein n=1 Tax=Stenoxybacter acetivorans TaxID=422441 RepID=UPI000689B4EC|nr:putative Ig domain-containing protein [Stenoxybacter acetivorans]
MRLPWEGDGSEGIVAVQYHGNDYLSGGSGSDHMAGNGGDDWLFGGDGYDVLFGDSSVGYDVFSDPSEDNHELNQTQIGNDYLFGEAGDDEIFGGFGDDTLDGGEGYDQLFGGGGRDYLIGGNDDDYLYGDFSFGIGNDQVAVADEYDDVLDGGAGDDELYGTQGNDTLSGGTGDDRLWGDDYAAGHQHNQDMVGDDRLYGGDGNDWLFGGYGDDHLDGGLDIDSLIGSGGQDYLDGGSGDDYMWGDFSDGDGRDVIPESDEYDDVLNGGDGNDQMWGGQGSDALYGGAGNDYLDGGDVDLIGDGNDRLYGEAGNDTLVGGLGDDVIDGGTDDDHMAGEDGNDTLNGGSGNDFLWGDLSALPTDQLPETGGNDVLSGGDGDDYLDAGSGNNVLNGGNGNDTLWVRGGTSIYTGGAGNDVFQVLRQGLGVQTITDFEAGDVLLLVDAAFSDFEFRRNQDDLVLKLKRDTQQQVIVQGYFLLPDDAAAFIVEQSSQTGFDPFGVKLELLINDSNGGVDPVDPEDPKPINTPPVVGEPLAAQTAQIGNVFQFKLPENAFTDPDGDVLIYRINNIPDWLHFDEATNTLVGTPPEGSVGSLNIEVLAIDPSGEQAAQTFVLNIQPSNHNQAPVVGIPIDAQTITENSEWTFRLPESAFTDPDGDVLTYRIGTIPDWLHFDEATKTLVGTPPQGSVGSLSIEVLAIDPSGEQAAQTFVLNIQPSNHAPVVGTLIDAQTLTENNEWTFRLPENAFTDPDGDVLTYRINTIPAWLRFDEATNTLVGTPPQGSVGSLSIEVLAIDPSGEQAAQTFVLNIQSSNHAPEIGTPIDAQTLTENSEWTFRLPETAFTDPDGDVLTYRINTIPEWLHFDEATNTLVGTPPKGSVGSLNIEVLAIDPSGEQAAQTFVLNIQPSNHAPIVGTLIDAQTLTENSKWTFKLPETAFTDADGDTLNLTATLENGEALPEWLQFNPDTQTFSGTAPSGSLGNYSIVMTAADPYGASISQTFTLAVQSAPYTVVIGTEQQDFLYLDDHTTAIHIDGRGGNDSINGSAYSDIISGGDGNDRIWAGDGEDLLIGGAGDDLLGGDEGRDIYEFSKGHGQDAICEYEYNVANTIRFTDVSFSEVLFQITDTRSLILSGYQAGDQIEIRQFFSKEYGLVDTFVFADQTLTLSDFQTIGFTMHGSDNSDWLSAGFPLVGYPLNLYGGNGDDWVTGDSFNDVLYGEAGNDNLSGDDGNDILDGGIGNDGLVGGDGDDCYVFSGLFGQDIVTDMGGADTLRFTDLSLADLLFDKNYGQLMLYTQDGENSVQIAGQLNDNPRYKIERIELKDAVLENIDFSQYLVATDPQPQSMTVFDELNQMNQLMQTAGIL